MPTIPPVPYREERPWGGFIRFVENSPSTTVKILTVKAGEGFSLQYHKSRDEFWHVISGSGTALLDTTTSNATPGDEFFIPRGMHHRLMAGSTDMTVLEIAFGNFDENEIVRVDDKYGRIK